MKKFFLEKMNQGWKHITQSLQKQKVSVIKLNYTILVMWIESTSGPTNRKPGKSKSTAKSPTKSEVSSKKTVVSPFKKIYWINESAKPKVKKAVPINIQSSEIKIKDNGNFHAHVTTIKLIKI